MSLLWSTKRKAETMAPIAPDGIRAAAVREVEAHPKGSDSKPITAWTRRATTLEAVVAKVNELDAFQEVLKQRPF